MRGGDDRTGELFSYVDLEARVRRSHPLRAIRGIVNEALLALEREFATLYEPGASLQRYVKAIGPVLSSAGGQRLECLPDARRPWWRT